VPIFVVEQLTTKYLDYLNSVSRHLVKLMTDVTGRGGIYETS